jgi:hypothetical protein
LEPFNTEQSQACGARGSTFVIAVRWGKVENRFAVLSKCAACTQYEAKACSCWVVINMVIERHTSLPRFNELVFSLKGRPVPAVEIITGIQ